MRELVEVIRIPRRRRHSWGSTDPVVRAIAVYAELPRRRRSAAVPRRADRRRSPRPHRSRRALVSVDDVTGVEQAGSDANREVRIAAANGLPPGWRRRRRARIARRPRSVGPGRRPGRTGLRGLHRPDATAMQRALTDNAWQIRQGAARGMAGAPADIAVPALSGAITDPHLDVRKAAVLSLTRWAAAQSGARDALSTALDDGDADVRASTRGNALTPLLTSRAADYSSTTWGGAPRCRLPLRTPPPTTRQRRWRSVSNCRPGRAGSSGSARRRRPDRPGRDRARRTPARPKPRRSPARLRRAKNTSTATVVAISRITMPTVEMPASQV